MTVTYTKKVSETTFCGFSRLLFRWRGSVFKLVWPDLIVYLILYGLCSLLYRFGLREDQKRLFEKIAISCEYFRNVFPISFVLGFYVTIVVQRWWAQYMLIPWPDTVCILASSYIQGQDERGRLLRKSFARYINLAFCLAFSRISPRVARRFATYQDMIDAGYLTHSEKVIFEMMDESTRHHKIWMPLVWASLLVVRARKEGRVPDDYAQKAIIHEITNLRYNCGKLQEYHTMSVPLVYTQVVTMATYSYFGFSILGRQFLDPNQGYENHDIDFYIPIFTFLQFIFYMGWLKVAESLLNPFGDDDDDFETNDFLDRHFEISYMIVDVMHKVYPDILQDHLYEDNSLHNVPRNANHRNESQSIVPPCQDAEDEKCHPIIKNITRLCGQTLQWPNLSPTPPPPRHNGDISYIQTEENSTSVPHGRPWSPPSSQPNSQPQPRVPKPGPQDTEITIHTFI
ncbi:bestrophin-2a-like isoform X2 [Macrobrachium rosenbergii]|uniref:bestrophin-2a-like isoform X2 n=1 Tax=Macrobrachium rosenbergii TaxID=79674 RepID=UPI0034D683B4